MSESTLLKLAVFLVFTLSATALWAFDNGAYIDADGRLSRSYFRTVTLFDESPRRKLDNLEEGPYLAVNRIVCAPDDLHTGAMIEQAVGTLVENQTTAIGVAHIFNNAGTGFRWRRAANCQFVIYKYAEIVDRIPLRSYRTSWSGSDSSSEHPDIAILELSRPPKWWIDPLAIELAKKVESVLLVTIGVSSGDRRLLSQGTVCDLADTPKADSPLTMAISASGQQGDSGSPIINSSTGTMIAVYVGSSQLASQRGSSHFDCRKNYNRAALISRSILGDIEWGPERDSLGALQTHD